MGVLRLLTPGGGNPVSGVPFGSGKFIGVPHLASSTTGVPTLNTLAYIPFETQAPFAIDRFGVECTTALASAVYRLGLYAALANRRPGALIQEFGTVDCSTTGNKEIVVAISFAAQVLYFLAAVPQGAAATMRTSANQSLISNDTFSVAAQTAHSEASITGALPATAATTGLGNLQGVHPRIGMRCV